MPVTGTNFERSGWREALQKGIWGAGQQQAPQEPAASPGSPEGKPHPGVHQTQHNRPVRRGDRPPAFSTEVASP